MVFGNTTEYTENTQTAISDIGGLLFNMTTLASFTAVSAALTGIIPLIPMFMRDHEKRLYSPTTFFFVASFYRYPFYMVILAVFLFGCLFLDIDKGNNYDKMP